MSTDLPLTPEDVGEIVAILDGTSYERVEIRTSRFALKVARSGEAWTQEWDWNVESQPASIAAGSADAVTPRAPAEDGVTAVTAMLPGTFYRAPQPGAAPFVQLGDAVTPTTVIGIVETMKLMTPIVAGVSGTVVAILVENATLIDAGAEILRVRANR